MKTFAMIFFFPKCASVSFLIQNIASAEYIHVPSKFFKFAENCPPPPLLLVAALPECEITLKTSLVIAPGSLSLTEKFFSIRFEISL